MSVIWWLKIRLGAAEALAPPGLQKQKHAIDGVLSF
jgi:hypothetical protein